MIKRFLCLLTWLLTTTSLVSAQKGLPAKVPTTANVNTFFPQHEDFKEAMASRLQVDPGFKVAVVATGLGKPRMMAVSASGALYITRRDQGDVLMLTDNNGDGRFDDLKTVWAKFPGVHGITIKNGTIYLCSAKELKKAKIKNDGTLEDTVTLIKDFPDGGQHDNRVIHFGPDGMLYVSIGSDCNDCGETNPEHATIVQVQADDSSRRIYARGLRNTIGFDWQPQTKEMWGCDNGTDWRGDSIPPEELNMIKDSADYGWPLVYGKQQVDETREDPPGSTKAAYAKSTEPAVFTYPAHSAPIDFLFMSKTNFPSEYKDDALVCWHGSWNRKRPEGFKIQRIVFEKGKPVKTIDFFSGFLGKDGKTRFGRPAGLAVSGKGALYISDDANGVIYSVNYTK